MNRALTAAVIAFPVLATLQGCTTARAQTNSADESFREGIELTVYSQNFAMVSENRKVDLPSGESHVRLTGVSRLLDENSVVFSFPGNSDARAISSTYDLGMDSSDDLLSRFLGQKITLVYRGDNGRAGERQEGILEVAQPGNIVVRVGKNYVVNPNATIEAPTDAGIVTIPQLSAQIKADKGASGAMNVAYLTEGLFWAADYAVTLAPGGNDLGLECWATIQNQSGADYPNARIKFVAGSPNRSVKAARNSKDSLDLEEKTKMSRSAESPMELSANQFRDPEAVGELYAYPYESLATIRQNQTNRVLMMSSEKVTAERDYAIALPTYSRWYSSDIDPSDRHQATLGLNFANSAESGLGQPLPQGAMRVYEASPSGAPVYIGAAAITNTPKGGKIHLTLSDVFDVYANAKIIKKRTINKKQSEYTFEAVIHNEKKNAVDVRLVQSFYDNFAFSAQSVNGRKLGTGQQEWTVNVPAGGEVRLTYTVVLS